MNHGLINQYVAAFAAALSAMMAGSAFSWVTQILVDLRGPDSEVPMSPEQSSWVVSLIEVGNLITPIPAGMMVDSWGRKPCLAMAAPLYIVSWLLVLSTRSVGVLCLVRFIQGIGMGMVYTVLPTYLGEIAEPRHRGTLSTLFEVMWYLGVLLQYCIAPFISYQMLAMLSLTVPVVYLAAFLFMPESPYYLLLVGRDHQAAEALLWLRGGDSSIDSVKKELKSMKVSVVGHKTLHPWHDLIAHPVDRRCLLVVQVVALLEVLCGIPAVLSYTTDALSTLKPLEPTFQPEQCTILMGASILMSTIVSAGIVDHLGRRPILIASCLGAAFCQTILGLFFYMNARADIDVSRYSWVAWVSFASYGVLLCGGVGALSTAIKSELFPSHTRGLGNGVTAMTLNIASFLNLKLYQDVEQAVGLFLNFWIYAAFGLFGAVFIYFYLPETRGKTFSEIHQDMTKFNGNGIVPLVEETTIKSV